MYLMWTVPITHLRHTFIQCCASFPLLRLTWIILIARNDRWFAHLHIQNGGSKRIWILTYSWNIVESEVKHQSNLLYFHLELVLNCGQQPLLSLYVIFTQISGGNLLENMAVALQCCIIFEFLQLISTIMYWEHLES
jgi:hypothetical protein